MTLRRRLSLALRKSLHPSLRHILRLGKLVIPRGQTSLWIPAHLLVECRMCASRYALLELLPRGARVAEVGTDKGDFARQILAVNDPEELHLIDLDFSLLGRDVAQDKRVALHAGLSHDMLARFPDDHFSWIYVDADHSHAGTARDAKAAASKVRPGGFLVFNDFAHMDPHLGAYGVHRAVVEFAVERDWKFAWFAYEPNALYDVALQRPAA